MIGWAKPATELRGLEKALSDFAIALGDLQLPVPDLVFGEYGDYETFRALLPGEGERYGLVRYASFILRYDWDQYPETGERL